MIGEAIGKCRLESVVGSGAMGNVYRAMHLSLGVPVAVKLIKPELAERSDLIERFFREAQLAARLRHPNLVRVYDVGEEGSQPYIVMEFLEGPTLEQVLARHAPFEVRPFFRLFRPLASGLAAAHKAGIVHRDIKPGNIILVEGGKPVLTDFGVAGALASDTRLTMPGSVLGTPAYMSPEQAQGAADLDASSDVFSMGMMMFEALSGILPQDGDNVLEVLSERINQDSPPLRELMPEVPAALAHVIDTALVRDPKRRWASAVQLSETLGQAQQEISSPGAEPSSGGGQSVAPPRAFWLPREGAEVIADAVDLRYADLQALLAAVEGASTGYGALLVHHPEGSDVLLFSRGTLTAAHHRMGEHVVAVTFEDVRARYEQATQGVIDALAIPEDYYRALKAVFTVPPTIAGMRLSFVDLRQLFQHLAQQQLSGVLRFDSAGQLGLILVHQGEPQTLWCGVWCDDAGPERSFASFADAVARQPRTRLDFHEYDAQAFLTADPAPVEQPLEPVDAELLTRFLVQALSASGKTLGKLFGLGSEAILAKHVRVVAQQYPVLLASAEPTAEGSLDQATLLAGIASLPQTGRRLQVVAAMRMLLSTRLETVQDALGPGRKLRKVYKELLGVWKKSGPVLEQRGLAAPFAAIFDAVAAQM